MTGAFPVTPLPPFDPSEDAVSFTDPLPGQWPSADIVTSLPDDLQSALDQFDVDQSGSLVGSEVIEAVGAHGLHVFPELVELQLQGLGSGVVEFEQAGSHISTPFLTNVIALGEPGTGVDQLWAALGPIGQQAFGQIGEEVDAQGSMLVVIALRLEELACLGGNQALFAHVALQRFLQNLSGRHPTADRVAIRALVKSSTLNTEVADRQILRDLFRRFVNQPEQFYTNPDLGLGQEERAGEIERTRQAVNDALHQIGNL